MDRRSLKTLALGLIIAAAILPAEAQGQLPAAPRNASDLVLERLFVDPPVVGVNQRVVAIVFNNGSEAVFASTQFSWRSGNVPLQSGGGALGEMQQIQPRERWNFTLEWTPVESQAGDGRVIAEVRIAAGTETQPVDNVKSVEVFVRHYSIVLSLDGAASSSDALWVVPPDGDAHYETIGHRFRVRNAGNVPDVANVTVEGNESWYFRATQRFFPLNASEEVESFVLVRPPSNATNQTQPESFRILASSESVQKSASERDAVPPEPQAIQTPLLGAYEAVQTNFSASLTLTPSALFVAPGSPVVVMISVLNAGTTADAYNVTPRFVGAAAAKFALTAFDSNVNASAPQVQVKPGERREIRFVLSAKEGLLVADEAKAEFVVRSVNWPLATLTQNLTARASGANLVINEITTRSNFYSGQNGTLSLGGRNEGDKAVKDVPIALRYLRDGSWVNVTSTPLNLTTEGLSAWRMDVPINTTGLSGRYRIEANVDPHATTPEQNESDNGLTSTFEVHTVALELHAPPPQLVVPGERLRLTEGGPAFYVHNVGSHDEEVELRLTSGSGIFNVTARRLVPANERLALDLVLDVPSRPLTTSEVLRAVVTVPAEGIAKVQAESILTIDDRSPPTIEVTFPDVLVAGKEILIQARIVDETQVSAALLHVRASGNVSQVLPLTAIGDDLYEARFTPFTIGELEFFIEAQDSAARSNTRSTEPKTANVTTLATAPTIVLDGDRRSGSTLGPGQAIRWTVLTETSKLHVNYSMDGLPRVAILPPYVVDADSLAPGQHVIVIDAVDTNGGEARATLTFVRDVTPPTLERVEYDVGSNGLVTIRVYAGPDAAHASVTGPDGRRVVLSASDPFQGMIAAAASDPLKVTLTDAAGNSASFDSQVPPANEAGSEVVLVSLLLIGLVAALVPRKGHRRMP